MPVGERADGEGAEHQPEESGGEQRSELRDAQLPFRANRGGDEPDNRRVETVDGDDEEAEDEQQPLQRRYRMAVDERLNVDDAGARQSLPTSSSPPSATFASSRISVFASAAVRAASSRSCTRRMPGST